MNCVSVETHYAVFLCPHKDEKKPAQWRACDDLSCRTDKISSIDKKGEAMLRTIKTLAAVSVLVLITACGGGGGGDVVSVTCPH